MPLQELNAPMNEFITWKRTVETTSQSSELRFVIASRMCELMDDCGKMCKKFLDETRQMYEKEKKQ